MNKIGRQVTKWRWEEQGSEDGKRIAAEIEGEEISRRMWRAGR